MNVLNNLIARVNKRASLRTRLLGGFLGIALVAIFAIAFFQYSATAANDVSKQASRRTQSIAAAEGLKREVAASSLVIYEAVLGGSSDGENRWAEASPGLARAVNRVERSVAGDARGQALLSDVGVDLARLRVAQDRVLRASETTDLNEGLAEASLARSKIAAGLNEFIDREEGRIAILERDSAAAQGRLTVLGVGAALSVAIAAVVLALLAHTNVIAPLLSLRHGLSKISAGDFGSRVFVGGRDEIGGLAEDLNQMADNLEKTTKGQRQKYSQLTNLYKMSKAITAHRDLDDLLSEVLHQSLSLIGAETGSIMLIERDLDQLVIRAAKGLDERTIKTTRVKLGEGISGAVAVTGKALMIKDEEDRVDQGSRAKDALSVPLVANEKVIGVINANNRADGKFDRDDLRFFSTIAGQIAAAVANTTLVQDTQRAYFETIKVLAAAIDAKDKYTYGHSERVAKYAVTIARQMGLPDEDVTRIEAAAYLHDIGKIGVPDSVLTKDGRLTDEEFAMIKNHPVMAAEILEHINFPWGNIIPGVRGHHERFDGHGYPDGLAGYDIPFDARIIAVADTFDAMTSNRPYRKALDKNVAITELVKGRGTQLEHEAVDAFIPALLTTLMSSLPGGIEDRLEFSAGEGDEAKAALDNAAAAGRTL